MEKQIYLFEKSRIKKQIGDEIKTRNEVLADIITDCGEEKDNIARLNIIRNLIKTLVEDYIRVLKTKRMEFKYASIKKMEISGIDDEPTIYEDLKLFQTIGELNGKEY